MGVSVSNSQAMKEIKEHRKNKLQKQRSQIVKQATDRNQWSGDDKNNQNIKGLVGNNGKITYSSPFSNTCGSFFKQEDIRNGLQKKIFGDKTNWQKRESLKTREENKGSLIRNQGRQFQERLKLENQTDSKKQQYNKVLKIKITNTPKQNELLQGHMKQKEAQYSKELSQLQLQFRPIQKSQANQIKNNSGNFNQQQHSTLKHQWKSQQITFKQLQLIENQSIAPHYIQSQNNIANIKSANQELPQSFNQIDWEIPIDDQINVQKDKRKMIPSLNMVMPNKFAQNQTHIKEQLSCDRLSTVKRQAYKNMMPMIAMGGKALTD